MMVASLGPKEVPEAVPDGLCEDGLVDDGFVGEGLVGDGLVNKGPRTWVAGLGLGLLAEIEGGLVGTPSSSSSPLLI